jgi:two-component system cell cycle response regulator DivK
MRRETATPKTVLVVEDNELNMKLFHDVLEAHGYNVLQTGDGTEALTLARQHRPDLIVMDIQLPQVCGLEITRQIKNDGDLKAIPIIAVTAFAMKGDQARILESGCEAYIAKPMSVVNFVATVAQLLALQVDGRKSSLNRKRKRVPEVANHPTARLS